ncbi:MAG: ABC transporter substrate-binding protein [Pseudomonadota bacterium]
MHSSNLTLSRRGVLAGSAALIALPHSALALSPDQATALIRKVVDETNKIVNSGASKAQALAQFETMFSRYADVPIIARSVLGPPWRSASGAQQQAFVAAFQGYLARKYGSEFREYRGAQIDITKAVDQGNKGVVVSTIVRFPGEAPVAVDWQVSDRSGSPKAFNLFIEGVSMLSTERSEISAILAQNRNDLDAMIAALKSRG